MEIKTIPINPVIRFESNRYHAKAFNEAVSNGLPLRIEVEKMLESRGLLDTSAEEKKESDLRAQLKNAEISLRKGLKDGRKMTLEEGKELALEMRKLRGDLGKSARSLTEYFNNSVESYADNERIQYFIYSCTVDSKSGNRIWKSFDEFKQDDSENMKKATEGFLQLLGTSSNFEKDFYENKWLINRGFMNSELQLIRKDGKLIDEDGRLINKDGRFINENGDFVDKYGNPVDADGNLLIPDAWEAVEVKPISTAPEPFGS